PAAEDERLRALAGELRLSTAETVAVALAVAVEVDAMAGRALAWLQSPSGAARPTIGLVALLAGTLDGGGASAAAHIAAVAGGRALDAGLLALDSPNRPLPESALRVPAPLALALAGAPSSWPGVEGELDDPPPLPE